MPNHIYLTIFLISPPHSARCLQDHNQVVTFANELSIPIKLEKPHLPSTRIVIHGIELDTVTLEARLFLD